MKNKEIINKIESVILCLMAHPDFEPNSEFEDRINNLFEIKKELSERQTTDKSQDKGDSEALHIGSVRGSFSATDVERAYDDGYSTDGEVTFDIENYR